MGVGPEPGVRFVKAFGVAFRNMFLRLQVVCATGVTLEVGYGPSEDSVVGG